MPSSEINSKVFCIGLPRTGTTSLSKALSILGYKVRGGPEEVKKAYLDSDYETLFNFVRKHDAFQDDPWPQLYSLLDRNFPCSKFILTIRDHDKWIRSTKTYFCDDNSFVRLKIYGTKRVSGNETHYLTFYQRHNQEVINYFANRPDDFLILNWEHGSQWDALCQFLDKPTPEVPFPFEHKLQYSIFHKVYRRLAKRLRLLRC